MSSPLVLSQDLICSYLMTGVQQKLNELYRDVHATFAARLVGLALSEPLFIAVPEAYERAGLRLVIVGQQTCSWYGGLGEHDVAGVLDCYRRFDLGGHGPHSPFWDHVHRLQRLLSPLVPEKGFVWANLVPCDQNRGRPVDCVLDALLSPQVFRREVRILAPDAVVFFTGPQYDAVLSRVFPGLRLEAEHGFGGKLLSRVVHPELPPASFRTFHPKYLRLRRLEVLSPIADRVRRCHGSHPAVVATDGDGAHAKPPTA